MIEMTLTRDELSTIVYLIGLAGDNPGPEVEALRETIDEYIWEDNIVRETGPNGPDFAIGTIK